FHAHDGYALEAQVGAVLTGLGFRKEDWQRATEEFSGGWQMRIALAKLLLQKPNLLLLDEPTNHLDLETRNWLEDYLSNYPYAFVLISHDRYFLDVTVKKTVEIWNKRVQFYSGNYEKYLAQREERKTQLESAYRNQREKIEHGDRIALVGANGAGKSTLIRMLSGSEPLTAGEYVLGHHAEPDYFAQDQYKVLSPERRMLDDLEEVAPRSTMTELRNLLGCFLFSDDDVFKTLGVLSGGERNRYALARMLLHPSNFLLLDEPTNHLDLRAKDVLLNALQEFSGTVVFVSHDRYFIDKLATRVFEVGGGNVEVFPGNYEDYLWRKQGGATQLSSSAPQSQSAMRSMAETAEAHSDLRAAKNGIPAAKDSAEPKQRRVNPIKLRQMKERVHEIEE